MPAATPYVRLVYASRASFPAGPDKAALNADLARILMQSRRNNPAQRLVGALYLGDGCFFQCLEGPQDAVDALYARLGKDDRHHDLTLLSREPIDQPSFSNWSMKYVPNAASVGKLLERHRLSAFDPYQFSPAMISDMVALLLSGPDALPPERPASTRAMSEEDLHATVRRSQTLAVLAVIGSALSLVVALLK